MASYAVIFRKAAAQDIEDIRAWIRADKGPAFANDFAERLITFCDGLSATPYRGTVRDDIRSGLRLIGWKKAATIAFRVDEDRKRVILLGVFLRGRDVATAVKGR